VTATPTALGDGQLAAGTAAIMMMPVTGSPTVLTNVVFSNTNTVVEPITIYLVRSGGAPGPSNIKINVTLPPAPSGGYVSPELAGTVLNAGDALYGFAADGGVVNFSISGAVFS